METEWTQEQEMAFARIMEVGHIDRLPAIRLFRRYSNDLAKALEIATSNLATEAQREAYDTTRVARLVSLTKARATRAGNSRALKGSFSSVESPALGLSIGN